MLEGLKPPHFSLPFGLLSCLTLFGLLRKFGEKRCDRHHQHPVLCDRSLIRGNYRFPFELFPGMGRARLPEGAIDSQPKSQNTRS